MFKAIIIVAASLTSAHAVSGGLRQRNWTPQLLNAGHRMGPDEIYSPTMRDIQRPLSEPPGTLTQMDTLKEMPASMDDITIMACSSDHKIFTSPAACDGVPIPIPLDDLVPSSHIIDLSAYISPACAKKRIPRYGSKKDIIAAFKCNQITSLLQEQTTTLNLRLHPCFDLSNPDGCLDGEFRL